MPKHDPARYVFKHDSSRYPFSKLPGPCVVGFEHEEATRLARLERMRDRLRANGTPQRMAGVREVDDSTVRSSLSEDVLALSGGDVTTVRYGDGLEARLLKGEDV